MPIRRYGVLKGRPVDRRPGTNGNPHYQVLVVDEQTDYRIAINVLSQVSPHEVTYVASENFRHPVTAGLPALPAGFKELPSGPGGLALDYIRGNLFDPAEMIPLPIDGNGGKNLNAKLDEHIQRAMSVETAMVYAFGQRWGPEDKKDQIFGFKPGNGIHDIHMNQANDPSHASEDGVWQDGGLLLHFPDEDRWVATFLKFQSQGWHSDDHTGHVITTPAEPPPPSPPPSPQPPPVVPGEAVVRIVAALVNPPGDDVGKETVTLLNVSPENVDLSGWGLIDRFDNKEELHGTLRPGAVLTVPLAGRVQLGNKGGILTLVDRGGLKVDGVSYTAAQARQGWTVVF